MEKHSDPTFWEDLSQFQFLNVVKALLCSFLNIIIYIILIALILGFDQGSILFVDLYTDENLGSLSLNVGLFHFLTFFLALIMSIYPTYVYTSLFDMNLDNDDEDDVDWFMDKGGLIYYDDKKEKPVIDEEHNPYLQKKIGFLTLKFIEGSVRKFLGVFLFIIWAGLIIHSYQYYQIDGMNKWFLYILYAFLVGFFLFLFWLYAVALRRKLKSGEGYASIYKAVQTVYKYQWYFFFILISIFVFSLYVIEWNLLNIIIQVIICFSLAGYLLMYRTVRKLIPERRNIVDFLHSIRIMGFVVLALILVINIDTSIAQLINPINVVLAGLITLYTLVTMLIKLFLYYKDNDAIRIKWFSISKKLYYSLLIIFGAIFIYYLNSGNSLHALHIVPTSEKVSVDKFYDTYSALHTGDSTHVPILYAAYGGGLKAHYWNYLILDYLDKDKKFNDILAFSGVSGGGMGLSNYAAMKYFDFDEREKQKAIDVVKNANILSIELSYLFGLDLLREMLPEMLWWGHDRSHRSMSFYNDNLTENEDLVNTVPFDKVYSSLFDKGYYPNIIINSTANVDRSGVVSAIRADGMFPGTINVLDIKTRSDVKTLTFFEAASTCNRFPVISPAANIPKKGHFVDGGYYENSGVMSLVSFSEYLADYEASKSYQPLVSEKVKLISVRNDRSNYVQSLVKKILADNPDLTTDLYWNTDKTEVGAITSSIFNLERTPTYLREYLKAYGDKYDLHFIDLPFYIDPNELDGFFGGTLNYQLLDKLKLEIDSSNTEIINRLKDLGSDTYDFENLGVVPPATARLLSRPAVNYMEAMMKHKHVISQLQGIE
ncbi:MAG: hypothetical protein P1U56_14830 [Saprospiraceae bacterium]|nr:hypothetical protein [Saprospiraceae bacterium]